MLVCENCGERCELIDVDDGGYEEVWGARIWVPAWTKVSDCCQAETEEVENEED